MMLHEAIVTIAELKKALAIARGDATACRARTTAALELAQEILGYTPEYFRTKWKLDERFRELTRDEGPL